MFVTSFQNIWIFLKKQENLKKNEKQKLEQYVGVKQNLLDEENAQIAVVKNFTEQKYKKAQLFHNKL